MTRLERLTPAGWQAVRLAYVEARALGHPGIAGEHLLLGVDVDEVRQRLSATFGADTLDAAERRVRRRPRWRGGPARPRPVCVHLLANRALGAGRAVRRRRDWP